MRRGRFPLRVLWGTQEVLIDGSDWHEADERNPRELQLLGNDQSDAALANFISAGGWAGSTTLGQAIVYGYVLEETDDPGGELVGRPPDLGANASATVERLLTVAGFSLLDYNLKRAFDRHSVLIQNNGPNPILIATLGDSDLITGAAVPFVKLGFGAAPFLVLNGAGAPGQAGGSLLDQVGWGTSYWGQATVANQISGAATVVKES